MDAWQDYLLIALLAYPYFWFQSFDPNLRVRVYLPQSTPAITFTTPPGPLSISAFVWTTLLIAPIVLPLVKQDPSVVCDMRPTTIWSWNFLLSVTAVLVATKVIFAPGGTAFTSYELTADGRRQRNWRLKAFDWLTSYPVNYIQTLIFKFALLPVAWALVWLGSFVGLSVGTSDIMPGYIFVAWTFLFLGRIGNFFVKRKEIEDSYGPNSPLYFGLKRTPMISAMIERITWPYWQRVLLLLCLIISWFFVYILLEKALRGCGAQPDTLPDLHIVLIGLIVMPVVEMFLGFVTASGHGLRD